MERIFFRRARIIFFWGSFLATPLAIGAQETLSISSKESLALRRITEYWKDGDYSGAKRQILDFLSKHPESLLKDRLQAMLGDLYFHDRNYKDALSAYEQIETIDIKEKTFLNKLQSYFEEKDYVTVIEKAKNFIRAKKSEEGEDKSKVRYLLGEAAFRQAMKTQGEERVFYLKVARSQYKILSTGKYQDRILFPLAESHRLLREDAAAAALYLKLVEKYPEHKERFLFQAAVLQIKESKEQALETFAKVHQIGGKRSLLAAFNQLILLYQLGHYEEYTALFAKVGTKMPEEKLPLLQFYKGRCLYYLGRYREAVLPLEQFASAPANYQKELKIALLLMVNCSRHLKDPLLIENALEKYKGYFPEDSEIAEIYRIHARMCQDLGDYKQALHDLKILTRDFPRYQNSEEVVYEFGVLLAQMDRFEEAREAFWTFIHKFPESTRRDLACRHLMSCCVEELKSKESSLSTANKESFVRNLDYVLRQDKVLTDKEKQNYTLVLIKCQCELGRYQDAMNLLNGYLTMTSDPLLLAEGHLLVAICAQKMKKEEALFTEHAEKALFLDPQLSEQKVLHLELYNSYLTQGELDKAAEHLFASDSWKGGEIKKENFIWLLEAYYKKAKRGGAKEFQEAQELFTKMIPKENGKIQLNITKETLYIEEKLLKYAHLLEIKKQVKEAVTILEALVDYQETQKQLPWKHKNRSALELALAYERTGEYKKALYTYKKIGQNSSAPHSFAVNAARLHSTKLEYRMLKADKRAANTPEVIAILHTLKDLQIQKNLTSEPLHLEAALSYAEIRSYLSQQTSDFKQALFFFKRMKEDFSSASDSLSAEYAQMRAKDSDKNNIYLAYMKYLDVQMLKCEARIALAVQGKEEAMQIYQTALNLTNDLLKEEGYLRPYLLQRVKRDKAEITKIYRSY